MVGLLPTSGRTYVIGWNVALSFVRKNPGRASIEEGGMMSVPKHSPYVNGLVLHIEENTYFVREEIPLGCY